MSKQLAINYPRFTVSSKNKTKRTSTNYVLNTSKQSNRKSRSINISPNFSPEYLQFKNSRRDATLNTDAVTILKFSLLLNQLYGDEDRACKLHDNSDPYIYSYEDREDQNGAFVDLTVKTSYLVGGSEPVPLATLKVYNTTNKIHLQGKSENVQKYIEEFLCHMMEITRCSQVSSIQNISCLQCCCQPNPNSYQPDQQLLVSFSPPQHWGANPTCELRLQGAPHIFSSFQLSPTTPSFLPRTTPSFLPSIASEVADPPILAIQQSSAEVVTSEDLRCPDPDGKPGSDSAELRFPPLTTAAPPVTEVSLESDADVEATLSPGDPSSQSPVVETSHVAETVTINNVEEHISSTPTEAVSEDIYKPAVSVVSPSAPLYSPSLPAGSITVTPIRNNTPKHIFTSPVSSPVISKSVEANLLSRLSNRVAHLEDAALTANIAKHELDNNYLQMSAELRTMKTSMNAVMLENQSLKSRLKNNKTVTDDLHKSIQTLQSELRALNGLRDRFISGESAINQLQTNCTSQKNVIKSLKEENFALKTSLQDARLEFEKLEETQKTLQTRLTTVECAVKPPPAATNPQLDKSSVKPCSTAANHTTLSAPPLMSQSLPPPLPATKYLSANPTRSTSSRNFMLGDSNLHNLLPIVKNRTVNIESKASSGANFASLHDEVFQLPPCDLLVLQGGTTDATQRDHPTDAIPDLLKLIRAARFKAKQVAIVPPPPTSEACRMMGNIMYAEARRLGVDFIPVSFPTSGPYVFRDDGLHCTKLGSGIYGAAIIQYFKVRRPQLVRDMYATSCVACHRSGHTMQTCTNRRPRRSPSYKNVQVNNGHFQQQHPSHSVQQPQRQMKPYQQSLPHQPHQHQHLSQPSNQITSQPSSLYAVPVMNRFQILESEV